MKKSTQNRRPKGQKRKGQPAAATVPAPRVSRRAFGQWLGFGAAVVVVGGGAAAYGVTSFMASLAEQDLSEIGNGTPAIVQIHDPQCPTCTTLQREARVALEDLDSDTYQYRVASLISTDGLAFAQQYGVGRVTVMLFDGAGNVVDVLTGPRTADQLRLRFQTFLDADA